MIHHDFEPSTCHEFKGFFIPCLDALIYLDAGQNMLDLCSETERS